MRSAAMHEMAQQKDFGEMARRLERAMDQLIQRHFSAFSPSDTWAPAINAYRLADRIEVCVELAGVAKESIDVRVEPGLLTVSGVRRAPQPVGERCESIRILAMEIDHGPFRRTFALPRQVEVGRVEAEQHNGLLWLRLPLSGAGQ